MSQEIAEVLAGVAPSLSNEKLGTVAQAFDAGKLGAVLRPLLGDFAPEITEAAAMERAAIDTKSATLPTNSVALDALVQTVYDSFDSFRRRSVAALARKTGLTSDAVLELIGDNADFRISEGRNTGNKYVSLRGAH